MEFEVDSNRSKKRIDFLIKKPQTHKKKETNLLNINIKRKPMKSTQDYLEILQTINKVLSEYSLSESQRLDFCKSQRYFMKLYLNKITE
ncbi:MAG: hypothetical protein GF317_13325 [Candidatus Lokiarchaeota archaeon]|nr:hypothetical protein [Candidatus Lokiarchaeota archaeon]MBD3200618.1 hypothetical protein [Candidatus Lokiarchaeota archaeon]